MSSVTVPLSDGFTIELPDTWEYDPGTLAGFGGAPSDKADGDTIPHVHSAVYQNQAFAQADGGFELRLLPGPCDLYPDALAWARDIRWNYQQEMDQFNVVEWSRATLGGNTGSVLAFYAQISNGEDTTFWEWRLLEKEGAIALGFCTPTYNFPVALAQFKQIAASLQAKVAPTKGRARK